jgi:hypothetical protein
MEKMWVDPPSGWQYGFPKLYDKQVPLAQWLIDNGYPAEDTEFALQYLRIWRDTDRTAL